LANNAERVRRINHLAVPWQSSGEFELVSARYQCKFFAAEAEVKKPQTPLGHGCRSFGVGKGEK